MNIFLIGDVMLGRLYNKKIPYTKIWGDSLSYLKKSDLVVGNLEMTITDHNVPYPNKVFNYKLSKNLAITHFKPLFGKTVFNTANNHILDFNIQGMKDTFNLLSNLLSKVFESLAVLYIHWSCSLAVLVPLPTPVGLLFGA